ncbi:MAG: helix-turn-helix domain-containing protein [Gemmatimonadetes bacterium]|nr:AraC family transcriptional regulator [Gemmatimonadota bacterium]NIR79726.1 AraC family transcriptional regulator [Gemmatimonadota bacterium]NIT88430.1 AraC family transcriptional regulator [Gemmatimonadota bacterium]NIU32245.1 AraC family transcriptional regulator [Gemmatimonadota bacterium]NIU36786.1 helix-turn-helix domain-containing protein [Gemmatimonadota bacterium]
MKFVELAPPAPLRPYVRLIWCLEIDTPGEFGPPERIAPDGIVELVFHYGDEMSLRFAGDDFAPQPRSSLVGQTRRYLEIHPRRATGLVSVRFRPWGALHFLGMPVSELADRVVPAGDVWGPAAVELEERLAAAGGLDERVAHIRRFLLDRLRPRREGEVAEAVRTVWRHRGHVRASRLYRELGVSPRTAQRIFRAAVGMPPKSYARLVRFLHACSVLRESDCSSLTEVGYACGYYDQAHFIADFKALSGMTPGAFVDGRALSFLSVE